MWVSLAEKEISIGSPEAAGWVALADMSLSLTVPAPAAVWVELVQVSLSVSIPPQPSQPWVLLAQRQIGIKIPGVVPPPPPPTPAPLGVEFPWLEVALVGGGTIIALVATAKPKKGKA